MNNSRAIAAKILQQVLTQNASLSTLFLEQLPAKADDQSLIKELCFGSCRWFYQLDFIAKKLLSKPLKNKDQDIYALIIVGLYQIFHTQIASHAAVSETVNAVTALKKMMFKGLMNGVLRNALREQSELLQQCQQTLAAKYAHPTWLIGLLQQAWPQQLEDILQANNERPPFCLRVNQRHYSRAQYEILLQQAGMMAKPIAATTQGLSLEKACEVYQLPGFAQGAVSVQDGAAQLAADLLNGGDGERVLDACCAPGGKTAHLLERNDLVLFAGDKEASRLTRVRENLMRLKLSAEVFCADLAEDLSWWDGQCFDKILLDAPCSATGVIRRHSDIKLLRRFEDLAETVKLQQKILKNLWQTLKPGGRLLYATCSVLPQENSHLVQQFLQQQSDAKEIKIQAHWGHEQKVGRQILPGENSMDGFYYALLTKVNDANDL